MLRCGEKKEKVNENKYKKLDTHIHSPYSTMPTLGRRCFVAANQKSGICLPCPAPRITGRQVGEVGRVAPVPVLAISRRLKHRTNRRRGTQASPTKFTNLAVILVPLAEQYVVPSPLPHLVALLELGRVQVKLRKNSWRPYRQLEVIKAVAKWNKF